jgi:hypothetical protein
MLPRDVVGVDQYRQPEVIVLHCVPFLPHPAYAWHGMSLN